MRAVRMHEYGGPDVLRYEEVPDPVPADGRVVVRVRAAGVNYRDTLVRSGVRKVPALPHVPGGDIVGEVRLPDGTTRRVVALPGLSCGTCRYCRSGRDNICAAYQGLEGGYAEHALLPESSLFPIPVHLSFTEAAALPVNYLTAWNMLTARAVVVAGETVLITGAGGGVGTAAILLARALGARVIAAVSNQERAERCLALGAEHAVVYSGGELVSQARRIAPDGVDVVIDPVGGALVNEGLRSLANGGRLVNCGSPAGSDPPVNLRQMYLRQLTIHGGHIGTRAEFAGLLELVGHTGLRPVVGTVLPLAEASRAHALIESRGHFGKIVLIPQNGG